MARLQEIRGLAEYTAKDVSSSPKDWMKYLDTAAKLYRYPFSDTLLIHAQRPDATACVSLEAWNQRMGRWVNRGAKGIALIDDTGPRRQLRYVFDVSDTHMVKGGRTPNLWQLQKEQEEAVLDHLADAYGLEGGDTESLSNALMAVASYMAEENLEEAMEGLQYEIEDSFLYGLDEDSIRVMFRELYSNSAFYILSRRCGIDPMEYLEEEHFFGITDFNRLSVLSFLGNAVSQLVEPILMDIGKTIRKIQMEEQEKTVADQNYIGYNEFNTLIRKSKSKGEIEHGTDLSQKGRLSVSEPDNQRGDSGNREIRDASEDISEGTSEELVSEYDADRETGESSGTDREGSAGENGSTDERAAGTLSGSGEGERSDGMDSPYEQPDSDGGGEHLDGIGIQLSEETTEQDLSEAEEIEASAFSLPALPTAKEQIREIEERMAALYAGEISISPDVVDEVLRVGGNREGSQLRIINSYKYIMEYSMYKTYGTKYRTSISKVIGKFRAGKDFAVKFRNSKGVEKMRVFYNEGFKRQKKAFQSNADLVPNTIKYFSSTKLIDRIKARECELCGKTNTPIEIHHVHRLKDLQGKTFWEALMIARNRKTIALCRECHKKLHCGQLN